MKPNKKRKFAVLDAETDPFLLGRVPAPFVWGLYDEEGFQYFWNVEDLIEHLRERNIIVYAHNGGRFDYHFLIEHLSPYEDILIVNGRLAKFKIGECEFRDSWLIIPQALAAYKKTEIDYSLFEKGQREKPENIKKILDYLRDDCKDLYELLEGFFAEYGQKLTLASTALSTWENMTNGKAPKSTRVYYDKLKAFYYGGRVECFRSGILRGPWRVYDINSAYPYAMTFDHPISIDFIQREGKPPKVFGHMFFTVRAIAKGCLPYRELNGELWFPNDEETRIYNVTGWEILTGLETGTLKIKEWISYKRYFGLTNFKGYVNHFYSMRAEAKKQMESALTENGKLEALRKNIYYKLMLNSLYGKFGANPDKYKKFQLHTVEDLSLLMAPQDDYEFQFGGEFGPWLLGERSLTDEESHYINVATSASITGFVRAFLFRSILSAEEVIYCDTDSIICRKTGANFALGDSLGAWKFEGEYKRAGIAGKKLYILDGGSGKDKIKMASKGGKLTPFQLWQLAQGKRLTFAPDAPTFSTHRAASFAIRQFFPTSKKPLENESGGYYDINMD